MTVLYLLHRALLPFQRSPLQGRRSETSTSSKKNHRPLGGKRRSRGYSSKEADLDRRSRAIGEESPPASKEGITRLNEKGLTAEKRRDFREKTNDLPGRGSPNKKLGKEIYTLGGINKEKPKGPHRDTSAADEGEKHQIKKKESITF